MSSFAVCSCSWADLLVFDSFGTAPPKTAYLYSCAALLQGLSMFLWSPLVTKYGKRPVYVLSYVIYLAVALGSGACKTWSSQLVLRCIVSRLQPAL